jgi:hypothetical protein
MAEAREWYEKSKSELNNLENFPISKSIVQRQLKVIQQRIAGR